MVRVWTLFMQFLIKLVLFKRIGIKAKSKAVLLKVLQERGPGGPRYSRPGGQRYPFFPGLAIFRPAENHSIPLGKLLEELL